MNIEQMMCRRNITNAIEQRNQRINQTRTHIRVCCGFAAASPATPICNGCFRYFCECVLFVLVRIICWMLMLIEFKLFRIFVKIIRGCF